MSDSVTAEFIAQAVGVSRDTIQRRAKDGSWVCFKESIRGGRQYRYPVLPLPAEIRAPVLALLAKQAATEIEAAGRAEGAKLKLTATMSERAAKAVREAGLVKFPHLNDGTQRKIEAKAALVQLCETYIRQSGFPKKRGTELFAFDYSRNAIEVPGWVRETIPSVSANSITNWSRALQEEGLVRLAGKQGKHRIGTGVIDSNPDLTKFIQGMLVDHPHCSAKHVMRGIRARFVEAQHPSYRTLQRWLADWKQDNEQLLLNLRSPDAWRSKFQAAGGDADAQILRLNQRWEADSTKGDLLLADGIRHIVVGIIDVYSRRLKLHVSRSSNAAAVASTMRRALLDWGVPEQLGTDNGSDYVSNHITRIVSGLGIDHDLAPPFTPEHKPFIERSFGTFCRDLVELLPGFIGHSVAERQDIESRRSFAQRLMKQGGEPIELRMSPADFQTFCDRWTDDVYAREPHGGLNGMSPFDVVAGFTGEIRQIHDERALDVLLSPAPDGNGTRVVGKKGIKLDNAWFEAPQLGGLEGETVRVLMDDDDIGEIYVFTAEGEFIAKAICPERMGISRQELSSARKAHQKRAISEQKAALKAIARETGTKGIVQEIMIERGINAGKVTAFPQSRTDHSTPALEQAKRASRHGSAPEAKPISAAEQARLDALAAELNGTAATAAIVTLDTPATRFRRALDIERALDKGRAVDAEDRRWLGVYSTQPEYRARKMLAEDFGEEAALEA
jgi:transposase InsO family protein